MQLLRQQLNKMVIIEFFKMTLKIIQSSQPYAKRINFEMKTDYEKTFAKIWLKYSFYGLKIPKFAAIYSATVVFFSFVSWSNVYTLFIL